jgi:hypothetical protein
MASKTADLSPVDFYLWDHLKSVMYVMAVNDVAELQKRVEGGCKLIRNVLRIFELLWQSLIR